MKKIMLFIPAYNCAKEIAMVLKSLTPDIQSLFCEVVVVENRSTDNTLNIAKEGLLKLKNIKTTLLQNEENYSLGGSHKVAFEYCLKQNYDYLVVLHGDNQADIRDIVSFIKSGEIFNYDSFLGSRFKRGAKRVNYSKFRYFGNVALNLLISLVTCSWVTDMGAGLNGYHADFLKKKLYMPCPDDLTFNPFLLLYSIKQKSKIYFFPIHWKEEGAVSNAKVIRQGVKILNLLKNYLFYPDFWTKLKSNKSYQSRSVLDQK